MTTWQERIAARTSTLAVSDREIKRAMRAEIAELKVQARTLNAALRDARASRDKWRAAALDRDN
jgi:hypothetical protein